MTELDIEILLNTTFAVISQTKVILETLVFDEKDRS